jgi:hypothetical protein
MRAIVLLLENKVRLTRWHDDSALLPLLHAVAEHVAAAQLHFESEVVAVSVSRIPPGKTPPPQRALRISNICGKIRHFHSAQFYNSGVLPLVQKTHNAFGSFETLLSVHGNLQTAQNRVNTLFRAGRCSTAILRLIEHAFDPECIHFVNVHMLVANVRLAHPITVGSQYLDARLHQSAHWQSSRVVVDEEQTYMKSFRLSAVCPEWQAAHVGAARVDPELGVLLNVSKSGCVNLFVSIGRHTPLVPGVELAYLPLLDALVRFVDRYT